MQDPEGNFSLQLSLRNLHPSHTAFWIELTLLRAAKGPDEPHNCDTPYSQDSSMPQPACSTAHSSEGCPEGTAGQGSSTCEPLQVGQQLDRKLRWVRVLPVLWSDNYLTIPGGVLSDTQVASMCLFWCSGGHSAQPKSKHGTNACMWQCCAPQLRRQLLMDIHVHQGGQGGVWSCSACMQTASLLCRWS